MTVAVTRAGGAAAPIPASAQDTPSDDTLIERIANGDRLAMRMLCARYQTPLYRLMVRLVRSEALAEELLNEVFLDVWRQAGPFGTEVSTWLFASAHRAAFAALQRSDAVQDGAMASAAVDDACEQDRGARIRRSLTALAPEHGEMLDLAYYHGKSLEEVAAILAVPTAAVLAGMGAARQRLAQLTEA
jgi:RNA polymerase sigma-70 factor (ECF subfamily)